MPEDIHLYLPFPSWCPFKVLQPHGLGQGPAVLVWVEVQKTNQTKQNPRTVYTQFNSHTPGQVQWRAPALCPGEGGTAVWAELLPGHTFLPGPHMPQVL